MKKLLFLTYFILMLAMVHAQVPNSFKYQAVVRDASGALLDNRRVGLRLSILEGSGTGASVYTMEIQESTNEYGIIAVNIGSIENIDWGEHKYYLQVDIDIEGGTNYKFMGTSQILAVPYALYALNVKNADDADADPTNEIQTIIKEGNTVRLSGTNTYASIDDGDADSQNEIQNLVLDPINNILSITNNPNATPISLSAYQGTNTDEQYLDYNFNDDLAPYGLELSILGGTQENEISIPFGDIVDAYQTGYPGYFNNVDRTKLNGIESGATADMTQSEIVDAYHAGYTNYFNLVDRAKLNGIEANATADMSNSEIVSAYQQGYPGYFNSVDAEKLDGIEIGATADMTNAEIGAAYNAWFPQHFTTNDRTMINRLELSNTFTVSGGNTVQLVSQANTSFILPALNGTLATEGFVTANSLAPGLSDGRILIGEDGTATELNVRSNGYLLIGDGSTLVSAPVTGDVSFSHSGGVTSTSIHSIGGAIVSSASVSNWNTAYSWGNHAAEGYLTSELDPVFIASPAFGISAANVTNWGEAYSWGDHSAEGYLTSELDPVFIASPAFGITAANVTNWGEAYSWGDHSAEGYLTSELDPVFIASPAFGISAANVTNWGEAYSWGDHSAEGYLTSELDPVFIASPAFGISSGDITNWNTASSGSFNSVNVSEFIQLADVDRNSLTVSAGAICFDDNELWYFDGTVWVQFTHVP